MKAKRLLQILKNDYVQFILLAIIIFVSVFAFWFGVKIAFQTDFPLLAVASGSMESFLYRGDLIIVQGISNFSELHVGLYRLSNGTLNPTPGEVIVFYDPRYGEAPSGIYLPVAGTDTHLIVHRAVNKVEYDGTWYFQTKGDNNFLNDTWYGSETWNGKISEKLLVGKVVGKVPQLGHIPLFMHENPIFATLIIVFLFSVLIILDFVFPERKDEKTRGQEEKLSSVSSVNGCAEEPLKFAESLKIERINTEFSYLKRCSSSW